MSNGWLRYVGAEANKILTHANLEKLGAWGKELATLGENAAVGFIKNVAQHVEPNLAQFIADHPALSAEFQTLSDDEAAAEVAQRKGPSEPASPDSSATSESAGEATPAENQESAAPTASA